MYSIEMESEKETNKASENKQNELFSLYNKNINSWMQNESPPSYIDDKYVQMMQKMGYENGSGLGKNNQGITKAIDVKGNLGKRGLGLNIKGLTRSSKSWDFSTEEICVQEHIEWLRNKNDENFNKSFKNNEFWLKEGISNLNIKLEQNFCDKEILNGVLEAKNIFDELNIIELSQARAKANPFETIKSVFFMNRAALKMANIDAVTDFMFTNVDQNEYHKSHGGPFYFADVCAGPGGFTEYILWRKEWMFKGFGLTLKAENDFKVYESVCASPVTFQTFYGAQEDGDVCNPSNVSDFKEKVLHQTNGQGVHFMMSDGGFCVDGKENIQEILSKNIYVCQCLVALEIVREHGNFVTKLFDVFTLFSAGLIFLMYQCFEEVAILKPNSSRPANSERYLICRNLKKSSAISKIKQYLWRIVERLWVIKDEDDLDIVEIVPLEVIRSDENFLNYVKSSNDRIAKNQIVALKKLAAFCRNPNLCERRQEELRKACLKFWMIPDEPKTPMPKMSVENLLNATMDKQEILLVQPRKIENVKIIKSIFSDSDDWHYCPMFGVKGGNTGNFYAGVDCSKVFRLQSNKWVRMKNVQLVRGTLLYGEFVKEKNIRKAGKSLGGEEKTEEEEWKRYSLHVIDALRLGETVLTDMKFEERLKLIGIYCESINKESQSGSVRIRPKIMDKLTNLSRKSLVKISKNEGLLCELPLLGYGTTAESFNVNSLLLLKTNDNQSFYSTYVLRAQIFITPCLEDEEAEKNILSWDSLLKILEEK